MGVESDYRRQKKSETSEGRRIEGHDAPDGSRDVDERSERDRFAKAERDEIEVAGYLRITGAEKRREEGQIPKKNAAKKETRGSNVPAPLPQPSRTEPSLPSR